tara:strand:- start:340 stop:1344 length:1005 start_codon:yes stop_codon:yes gene_type:complete
MIFLLYFSINFSNILFLVWILIPITIIFFRYLVKLRSKRLKEIIIIGTTYKFNDNEIKLLSKRNFNINFVDNIDNLLTSKTYTNDSLIVINYDQKNPSKENNMDDFLYNHEIISLDVFMEEYLRKLYVINNELIIGLRNYSRSNYILKLIIDYTASIILFPVFIILYAWIFTIKLLKRFNEPIFYKQKRYGLNKKIFSLFKVRTMYMNSEDKGNTIKNDDRVYPFARNLRKYRLDELPQILNIFAGHMHLVGPRAEWVKLSDDYHKNIPNYSLRHIVKPGVTGWAQIMYRYGVDENDAQQKLMYDLYYIKHWTIWLELEICIKTLFVILDKRGF